MADERDQKDVLPQKGNVTQSERGLQIWDDDDAFGDGVGTGTGGSGTAERAAKIARGQRRGPEP